MLSVASTSLPKANGDDPSDSKWEWEKEADGEGEEIDGHDRQPRNRDCDATVKGLQSDSLRRGSITDG